MQGRKETPSVEIRIGKRAMLPIVTLIIAATMAVVFLIGAITSQWIQRKTKNQEYKTASIMSSVMNVKNAQALIKETKTEVINKQSLMTSSVKNQNGNQINKAATQAINEATTRKTVTSNKPLQNNTNTASVLASKPVEKSIPAPVSRTASVAQPTLPAPSKPNATEVKSPGLQTAKNSTTETPGASNIISSINQEAMRAQLALASKASTAEITPANIQNKPASTNTPPVAQSVGQAQRNAVTTSTPTTRVTQAKALITQEMVDQANKTNKIEAINSEKLGVSKINTDVVLLKNGGSIRVGEKFPSGETLLSLDPDNGQIVTSKRTLLLF